MSLCSLEQLNYPQQHLGVSQAGLECAKILSLHDLSEAANLRNPCPSELRLS
jgi:hypothetical protein